MKLSLVTGTLNRRESLDRLIRSVMEHTSVEFELIVADASDEPIDELSVPINVRILPERPRLGCTKGYNRAFREARGEWVIWLNDDAEVCQGYADAAIRFMEAHPQIGLGALHYSEDGGPFRVNAAYQIIYANFGIIRKSLGDAIGWMDDELHMYGNDNSLAFRVLMANYGIADIPDAKVIHHSEKDSIRAENQRHRHRDNDTLSQKYMPYIKSMRQTYNRYRIHSGFEPWSHGQKPQLVG